jgi:histidine ammonia-lyase
VAFHNLLCDEIQSKIFNYKGSNTESEIDINGETLSLEELSSLGNNSKIKVSSLTLERLKASRQVVDDIVHSGVPTYGINTGFGVMSNTNIPEASLQKLQRNLIRSHASGKYNIVTNVI